MHAPPTPISVAVEGPTDEAVAKRLITYSGGQVKAVYGKQGKPHLRRLTPGYAHAARFAPWLILVDLDHDFDCAPPLRAHWQVPAAGQLCFRVAVREIEAWLLADSQTLAAFLSIRQALIPPNPEALDAPKRKMVDIAAQSRRRAIRQDFVPRAGSGRTVGPGYTSRVAEFVRDHWRPNTAAQRSASLRRAVDCLRNLVQSGSGPPPS